MKQPQKYFLSQNGVDESLTSSMTNNSDSSDDISKGESILHSYFNINF